jgi:hypothetical protein
MGKNHSEDQEVNVRIILRQILVRWIWWMELNEARGSERLWKKWL